MITQLPKKTDIIEDYRLHDSDTGSASVQIALVTSRINHLTEHLKANPKDHSSRRGLLKLVGHRRRLLDYIKNYQPERYYSLLERLDLRK